MLIADLATLFGCFLVAYYLRWVLAVPSPLRSNLSLYLDVWPLVFLWPFMFWREGLYPGLEWFGGEHLRRIVAATTTAFLIVGALTFITKSGPQYSRPILVGTWGLSLIAFPLQRLLIRRLFSILGWHGPRTIILGTDSMATTAIKGLLSQQPPSLTPVAAFSGQGRSDPSFPSDVPIVGGISEAASWAMKHNIRIALLAGLPGSFDIGDEKIEELTLSFPRFLVLSDSFGFSTYDIRTRDITGHLALEMRKNLLYTSNRILKRLTDLLFLVVFGSLSLPLLLLISLAILFDGGRPIFFQHKRIGFMGRNFNAWKFRTMVHNADEVLEKYLERDPALREEWQVNQKLRNDPRLTRVGRLLRRFSLDELPQLWNILVGDMSLVGPRPIVEEEIERYGGQYSLYTRVRPGLTGLWQVSGRSDRSYEERVSMDVYYVRNWSLWLDLIIIARTFSAVLTGAGAY